MFTLVVKLPDMKAILFFLYGLLLSSWASVGYADPALAPSMLAPNIVYILADDLGYGDLSCYGQTKFKTPHIDSLAQRGMRFTQHYAGSAVCAPSRCTLMTGLHTGHAPVRGNTEQQPEGQAPMPAGTYTVAKCLQEAGYKTGCFGKWGLGYPGSESDPLQVGFDHFYGYNCQRLAHCYYPAFLWCDKNRELLWGNVASRRDDYAPDLIHAEALKFIRQNRETPFFCYYAAVQPHADMVAPEKYLKKYRGKYLPEFSYTAGYYAAQSEGHAAFAGMVNVLDDYVGELIAELDRLGIADNTLVILTSDNGPHQEGGHDPEYFSSSGPLKGKKRDLYEGGVRVPMIAAWPGKVAAGTWSDHVSAFWDFLPTVAELVGSSLAKPVDGISMLPTLLGRGKQQQHDYLYWEFHEMKGRVAIRQGKWKGVRYHVNARSDSPLELYDLSKDLGETNDIAFQFPQVAAKLNTLLLQARTESSNPQFNFHAHQR